MRIGGKMKRFRRIAAMLMAVVLCFSLAGCSKVGSKSSDPEMRRAIDGAGKFLTKKITKPHFGDEVAVIALNRSDYIDYWHNRSTIYVTSLDHDIKSNGYMISNHGDIIANGYPPAMLAITAVGIYADKTSSADLTTGISYDSIVLEGGYINKIRALTALECGKYNMYDKGDLSRQDLIDFVMSLRQEDGSFNYKGADISPIEITASAVTALALTEEENVKDAVEQGAQYLMSHIRENDKPTDIVQTIIALNTAGYTADDVNGKDLVKVIMSYQRENGAFSFDTEAKKGNIDDTAMGLLGLASQYRYEEGLSSIFDMRDVLGATHNKLSPGWLRYTKLMKYFVFAMIGFLISLYIVSRVRIARWKKEGIYDFARGCRMSDDEIAEVKAKQARKAAERELEAAEIPENTATESEEKPAEETSEEKPETKETSEKPETKE